MAEIHVEPKKHTTPAWIWILVGLIIIAAIAYFVVRNNKTSENTGTNTTPTSYIQEHRPASLDIAWYSEAA